jgi:ATP-binding cassette subfamily B protein
MAEKPDTKKRRLSFREIKDALRIYRFILPYKWHFIVGMICLVISTSVVTVIPGMFGKLVNAAQPAKEILMDIKKILASSAEASIKLSQIQAEVAKFSDQIKPEELKHIGLVLGIVLIIQAILSYFRIYLFEIVSQRGMANIRTQLYEKIITSPITFFESTRVGELTSRLSSDVSQLQESLSTNLAMFVRQLVLPIACIPMLFVKSPWLTFVMLSVFPVVILSAVIFGRYIRKISKQAQDRLAESMTVVEETFQGVDVVKAYTNEGYETRRYSSLNDIVVNISLSAAKYRAGFVSFIIFAMFGAIVLIVWQGLSIVASNGSFQMGDLIEFLLLTVFIGSSLAGLSESYTVLQKTVGASERINQIMSELSEVETKDENLQQPVVGNIEFKHVGFSYPSRNDITIFNDLNFAVTPGQKIALVGPSGSGKSTIIKLLSGYYPFSSGDILIDGKSIRDYNLTALRKNMGMVPQDTMLFGGTIKENIAYGKPGATDAEIEEAARKANAYNFIETFPEKFETVVGERGVKLSGGQKQRVAIARAILRDPRILILDEATSALDSESEKLVKEALDELMKNRTTFIIAHRLSTIRQADKILVINKGKIVEQGTHEELGQLKDGIYSNLLRLQYELE